MKTHRIVISIAAIIAGGVLVYACNAPQAQAECQPAHLTFAAKYKLKSGTGACSQTTLDAIFLDRYFPPKAKEGKLAIRSGNFVNAYDQSALDGYGHDNVPAASFASDGTPVYRGDPNDPDGKKMTSLGKLPQFPDTNAVCTITDIEAAVQNFDPVDVDVALPDGGTDTENFPALAMKYEWSNFKMTNTANVPGSVWTADLKYTEDGCVAQYEVTGVAPYTFCSTDDDCDPKANPDAGRLMGSGINPDFKPKCDTTLGVCWPGVDDITKVR